MSTLKVGLLLAGALCNHISFTPPQPPPSSQELLKDKEVSPIEQLFGRIVRAISAGTKYTGWAVAICESAVILANEHPSNPISQRIIDTLVWDTVRAASAIQIAPVFLAGCGIVALSAWVRVQCYNTLGRHFTFELSLKREHKLVTVGPYSVVRHPSYTALILSMIGVTLCHASEGSWLRESGVYDTTYGRLGSYVWLVMSVYASLSLVARTVQEDGLMKKQFGEQWSTWANRVPYRLIPGLF